ncbi:MAG: RsbRD N-terminal domain-containing protein [Melioribacteraceae bacterium]|nr:RsbRD N-terminal domain-containing protein [Melioribacteraceae bacterium]
MHAKLIDFINENIGNIINNWCDEVQNSEFMDHYKTLSRDELIKRGEAVLINLLNWFNKGASTESTKQYFEGIGAIRLQEGFSLTEVNYAFYSIKKNLIEFIISDDNLKQILPQNETCTIMNTLNNFFDLGNFFILRGYNSEMFNKIEETGKLSSSELKRIFRKGSLDVDEIDGDEIIWRHIY